MLSEPCSRRLAPFLLSPPLWPSGKKTFGLGFQVLIFCAILYFVRRRFLKLVSFEEVSKWVSFTGSESKVSVDKEEAVKLLWTLDSGKKIYLVHGCNDACAQTISPF